MNSKKMVYPILKNYKDSLDVEKVLLDIKGIFTVQELKDTGDYKYESTNFSRRLS